MQLRQKVRTVASKVGAVALSLILVSCLSGCKYTDVLTEHIEDETLGVIDLRMDPIYKETPGAEPDPTRMSAEIDDSERIDDQTMALPDYSQDPNNNDQTEQREHEEETSHDQEATEGEETSESDGQNSEVSEGESSADTGDSKDDSDQGAGEDDPEEEAGDGPLGGDEATAGPGGEGDVYDTTGEYTELPENVGSIAACGQYATIVQMLAGKGGLACADDGWVADVAERGLFPDEGVEDLPIGWTRQSDGTYAMDLEAILETNPDAILVDNSDVVLSADDQAALTAAGVNVITVPNLNQTDTTDKAIVDAVNVVGELLKNSTTVTYDTQAQASQYSDLRQGMMDTVLSANGGYSFKMVGGTTYQYIYQCTDGTGQGQATTELSDHRVTTAYIDDWYTNVRSSSTAKRKYNNASLYLDGETMDASSGVGVSATTSSRAFVLLDYYLQMAGVVDNAYDRERPASSDSGSLPYVVVPGATSELVIDQSETAQRSYPSALWYTPSSFELGSTWLTVGDETGAGKGGGEGFPGILTRDADMAQKVVDSAASTNGVYNVGQPYSVWVVPSGICGSWADGTVESFLSCVWAYCLFQNGDAASCETRDTYVNNFYHVFYRVDNGTSYVTDYDTTYQAVCPTE